jgi:cobalt-zinc-cadmium efflux system outer membrane protein
MTGKPFARVRPYRTFRGLFTCMATAAAGGLLWTAGGAHAQSIPSPDTARVEAAGDRAAELEALIEHALTANPSVRAAQARVEAARAAVGPADALPDPMLSVGVMNFPTGEPGFDDMMTMKTVGIGQTLPFPGKLGLRRRIAEHELAATEARFETARLEVVQAVKDAYYELAFLDRALEIIRRNERLLGSFIQVTEARYGVGAGSQADVLKARVEASRLAEEAVALTERRRATLARLNAVLDRSSASPLEAPAVPLRTARAAVPDDAAQIRFTSAALGSRAADSPLPPLTELQERALRQSPSIRAHEAEIAAEAARVELARRAHLPDLDLSIQYGQRNGASDLLSAMISVPLPIHRAGKQDLAVRVAEARLAALQAEHHKHTNEIRAHVAEAYADLERERAQLALFVKSILPQGRAALESATAGFQVGDVDFLTLLENQAVLYDYETQYHRALSSFAGHLAELERTVGEEILR